MSSSDEITFSPKEFVQWLDDRIRKKLQRVRLRGDIRSLRRVGNGHISFNLTEAENGTDFSVLCFQYCNTLPETFEVKDGMSVEVMGHMQCLKGRSMANTTVEVLVEALTLQGQSLRALQRAELLRDLELEGWLDPNKERRPLPTMPSVIGVISNSGSEGYLDFVRRLRDTAPWAYTVLIETPLQGSAAGGMIAAAVRRFNADGGIIRPDVMAIVRGGGDDLSAFDDPLLVQAIKDSQIPVVTGIGHTANFMLADIVADVSAEVPGIAADKITCGVMSLQRRVTELRARLDHALKIYIIAWEERQRKTAEIQRVEELRREAEKQKLAAIQSAAESADRLTEVRQREAEARAARVEIAKGRDRRERIRAAVIAALAFILAMLLGRC